MSLLDEIKIKVTKTPTGRLCRKCGGRTHSVCDKDYCNRCGFQKDER